jgi:hypothetical protein
VLAREHQKHASQCPLRRQASLPFFQDKSSLRRKWNRLHAVTMTKMLYLRNWSVVEGDVANILRGFSPGSARYEGLKTVIKSSYQSLQNRVFGRNLINLVEANVKAYNGDRHGIVDAPYRCLSEQEKARFWLHETRLNNSQIADIFALLTLSTFTTSSLDASGLILSAR